VKFPAGDDWPARQSGSYRYQGDPARLPGQPIPMEMPSWTDIGTLALAEAVLS
jgi:hypothetical protein